jgi:predicted dehydrogenase
MAMRWKAMEDAAAILNVDLTGAGWVTQRHLPAWKKLASAKLVAVCDPDERNACNRATEFETRRVDDLETLRIAESIYAMARPC